MPEPTSRRDRLRRPRSSGLLGYVATWLAAGAAATLLALALTHHDGRARHPGAAVAPTASLPPLHAFRLRDAIRRARCRIEATERRPTAGGATPVAGVSRRALSIGARQAAVGAGMVVIEYRGDVRDGALDRLASLQRALPNGTVLAPSARLRADQVAATVYGRRLRCPVASTPALEAVRLFRGRYVGVAPS